jgi:1-acyl-sn-glycerol-3-phosphate acyltransferase
MLGRDTTPPSFCEAAVERPSPPSERGEMTLLSTVMTRVVSPIARMVYRPTVEGLENIPGTGPVILAANHLSFVDSMIIPIVVPRRVYFLAKAEYFEGTGVRGALSRWFFTGMGNIPVRRGQGRSARDSLDTVIKVLEDGGAFGIYPEGTRSLDGMLHRGRTGVARIALESGAPVVPIGLVGTDKVMAVGRKLPKIVPVTVRFGKPLDFSRYAGMQDSLPVLRSVTDQIVYNILELSGQDYVDNYQASASAA